MKRSFSFFPLFLAVLALLPSPARPADYQVGPGGTLAAIADVPWDRLLPDDRVAIHWRPEPYKEKWMISALGTQLKPIVICGIPGPQGQLPVIDGADAVAVPSQSYRGGERCVIKIGSAGGVSPAWIVLENLDVRGARPPFSFTGPNGIQKYVAFASSIWVESGGHITVRGCSIHDSANGFFSSHQSRDLLVERCHIYGNGVENSELQHNVYTESDGIVFQYNRLSPLRAGCRGTNLKDRSAGLVVRCNWIEGGNREMDIVDADDSAALRAEPAYRKTFVYGNVIIEPPADGLNQIIRYGGDMGKTGSYRKGKLYFYNNTVISRRTDSTVLFRVETNDESVDCRNNILYVTAPGKSLAMLYSAGRLDLVNDWVKNGWVQCHGFLSGAITASNMIEGSDPGFQNQAADDYHLAGQSPCRGAGVALNPDVPLQYSLERQYVPHQSDAPRSGNRLDLGAFGALTPP